MKDTDLVQGIAAYWRRLQSYHETALHMVNRGMGAITYDHWVGVADSLATSIYWLEKEFPFLKQIPYHKEKTEHGL